MKRSIVGKCWPKARPKTRRANSKFCISCLISKCSSNLHFLSALQTAPLFSLKVQFENRSAALLGRNLMPLVSPTSSGLQHNAGFTLTLHAETPLTHTWPPWFSFAAEGELKPLSCIFSFKASTMWPNLPSSAILPSITLATAFCC